MPIFVRSRTEIRDHGPGLVMALLSGRKAYLAVAMLAAATMLLDTAWMGDDAFITLRVIDNFVNGFGLRYNVIERVQVFTHPLWLMLLTPFYALTREAMVTTMAVSVLASLGALWLLAAKIARNIEYGCLLVLLALASRSLSSFFTSGLENPLTYLLLALFVWLFDQTENAWQSGQTRQSGTVWIHAGIAGLLLLNRLDLAVLLGPILAYLLFRASGMDRVKVAVAAIFPALAWMVFSVIYYGAPFPNTAYAKLGNGFGAGTLILRGLEYTKDFALADPLLALIMVKAVFDSLRSQNWPARLLGIGIVMYVVYTIAIGGDFMSGRFFTPPGFLAFCLLARARVPDWLTKRIKVATLIAVGMIAALLVARAKEQPDLIEPANGIADEKRFYYSDNGLLPVLKKWLVTGVMPIHPWGLRGEAFKSRALAVGRPIVVLEENAGMPGYYAGPTVHILDEMALADAFLARLPALPGARVGHYKRVPPPGYAGTLFNDAPTTEVGALRPLLNDVTLATRAPLFARDRWGAIWRLLAGRYSWIYQAVVYGGWK
jgi:arabinofuranosyltransferase